MEKLEITVKLTHQKFNEAGGKEVFPDLEIAGTVIGNLTQEENSAIYYNKGKIDQQMNNQALRMGATHIFGIEYRFRPDSIDESSETVYGAVGTAYKPIK